MPADNVRLHLQLMPDTVLSFPFNGPVCLHRWNTLAADNVGVHLQLMPMLLGFLTYKGAVIARGRVLLINSVSSSYCRHISNRLPCSCTPFLLLWVCKAHDEAT